MEAIGRFVLLILAVAVGGVLLFGGAGQVPLFVLVPVTVLVLVGILRRRRGGGADLGWKSGARVGEPSPAAGIGELPALGTPPAPASRSQVTGALARVEARQWLLSPWFAIGVGFCALMTLLFGWFWAAPEDSGARSWWAWFALAPIMAHPMVGMAVVGAHQAVTRGRRDGSEELFDACPTSRATRALGHLRSGWVPPVAIATFLLVMTTSMSIRNDATYGPIDLRVLGEIATAIVLGGCGAWLGVALGRWAPWRLAPIVVVAAVLPAIIWLGNVGDPHWSNLRQLSTWPRYPDHDLVFTAPPIWWHVIWLAALGALMGTVALAKGERSSRVLPVGLAVVLIAAVAGIAQTRPLPRAESRRLASLVTHPELHQVCRVAAPIDFCAYKGYESFLDRVSPHLEAVAAAFPAATPRMTFRQAFDGEIAVLGPEVAAEIAANPRADAPQLLLPFQAADGAMLAIRLRAAFAATGLPTQPLEGGVPTVIAGQARGVVALWLAARGLDGGAARRVASHHYTPDSDTPDRPPTALDLGMAWPDACIAESPPVAWSAQDLAAARALLELPQERVHQLLLDGWERFTRPATTTDELLAAAGLPPVGPPDQVVAAAVKCSY